MKHKNLLRVALCVTSSVMALSASMAVAQDAPAALSEEELLGRIIVYTNRAGGTPLELPANVTVVDGEEIDEQNISDVEELARYIPGVEVYRQTSGTDPFSTFGGVEIRGVGGNRVQLQVDGSRMAERITDGTRDYFDLNFTKQAEIVRGPASVLWGADALGGVVALETIDPEDILQGRDRGAQASLSYDSFNQGMGGSVSFAQRLSPSVELLFGLSREHNSEIELSNAQVDGVWICPRDLAAGATPCNELDPTSTQSTRGLAKLVWTPNDDHRFEFSADILNRDTSVQQNSVLGTQVSSFSGLPTGEEVHGYDHNLDLSRQSFAVEHEFTPAGGFFDSVTSTLAFVPHEYDRTGTRRSTSSAGDEIVAYDELTYTEDFLELDVQATAGFDMGNTTHDLILGFDGDYTKTDYFRRTTTNNLTAGTTDVAVAGGFNFANATTTRADIYLQDTITFGGGSFELTPGLRYATYEIDPRPDSDYGVVPGSEPVVRSDQRLLKSLGAMYRFNDTYSVWAKYGEGFKMPTAQQLYTSLPGSFFNLVPAPDLLPEEVESYEIGLRGEYDRGFFAVNAFKADYTNFIQSFYFVPGTNDITYRNLYSVETWGIEASGSWEFNDLWSADFTAAWQRGKQQAGLGGAVTTHNMPPLSATIGLTREIPQHNLTVEAVATLVDGYRENSSDANFNPGGYGLLDLHAKWQVIDNGALNFSVRNVFDRRYFTAGASTYTAVQSDSVARTNPIELQTGPGRTFAVSFDMEF